MTSNPRYLVRRAVRIAMRCLPLGVVPLIVACGDGDPPKSGPRPSQPTLPIAPAQHAASTPPDSPYIDFTAPFVVAAGQIAQPWHTGAWSPASITLSAVDHGDTIVVIGAYWGDLPARASTAPTDDQGKFSAVVEQGSETVGKKKPPVFTHVYVQFDAKPGAHTIVPPWLGGVAGDGTMYVVQLRNINSKRVISGKTWQTGGPFPGVSVKLDGVTDKRSLVLGIAAYDNVTAIPSAGWTAPQGWDVIGVQDDAANNVPSQLVYRVVPDEAAHQAAWTWKDPTANVVAAAIASFQ